MMESTQVLELTQTLEASQATESPDSVVKVGRLTINGVDHFVLNKENTIGRDENCDIVINSKAVSVEHAIIEADAYGKHLIWDLGSTNKTRLGELQLKPRARHYLNDGARLRFANVNAVYHHIKFVPPQKPPLPPVVTQIPGTPERAEESAAISSVIVETPTKDNENDADSDGDFFGDQGSSALFLRPLFEDAEKTSCGSDRDDSSLNNTVIRDPGRVPALPQTGQIINESSVSDADTSKGDTSDIIPGSQPMFTPEKPVNIYDVDTEPIGRVSETPVKGNPTDQMNWDNIDDSIDQISQEMDTIDTLIENKELNVMFSPSKRTSTVEGDSAAKPSGDLVSKPLSSCFNDAFPFTKSGVSSSKAPTIPVEQPGFPTNIYELNTEPFQMRGQNEASRNIFDLETQQDGSNEVSDLLEAETSVYDLATQPFFAADGKSEKPPADPGLVGSVALGVIQKSHYSEAGDVSMSDLPTQAAGTGGRTLLTTAVENREEEMISEIPAPSAALKDRDTLNDNSVCDMLTQPTSTVITGTATSSPLTKSAAEKNLNISISDMGTQQICKESDGYSQGVAKPTQHSPTGSGMACSETKEDVNLNNLMGLDDVSLSDMATQPRGVGSPAPSCNISLSDMCTQLAVIQPKPTQPPESVDLADLQTQTSNQPIDTPVALKADDSVISDHQTQTTDVSLIPSQKEDADVSIRDLPTQSVGVPPNLPELPADISISDMPTQVNSSSTAKKEIVGTDPEDIYNVMTQMPVAEHNIMFEDSNTERIELELEGYEEGVIDNALRKSDGSGSIPTSPFKTPVGKPSPEIPRQDPTDIYLLETQPVHVAPFPVATDVQAEGTASTENYIVSDKIVEPITADASAQEVTDKGADVYNVETQDINSDKASVADVDTVPLVPDPPEPSNADLPPTLDEDAVFPKTPESPKTPEADLPQVPKQQETQDVDANSVENRIRAMNHSNVNSQAVERGFPRSTVAELLQTLEGTPSPARLTENQRRVFDFSQTSDTLCSQFPLEKRQKKVKPLVYSDSEDSRDSSTIGKKTDAAKTLKISHGELNDTEDSALCSQFPVEKHRKNVKILDYTDSEDSAPSPITKKNEPIETSDEEKCQSEDPKLEEPCSLAMCNGNQSHSLKVSPIGNKIEATKTELVTSARELADDKQPSSSRTTLVNDTGDSESLQLQLTDASANCSVTDRSSLPLASESGGVAAVKSVSSPKCMNTNSKAGKSGEASETPRESNGITPEHQGERACSKRSSGSSDDEIVQNSPEKKFRVCPKITDTRSSRADETGPNGTDKELLVTTAGDRPSDSAQSLQKTPSKAKCPETNEPVLSTTPSTRPENPSPETPEIPKDFFGTPMPHGRPPLRQYTNRKKLSLKASPKRPNASSTPLDSYSIVDMEQTLLTTIRKTGDSTGDKETANDDLSLNQTPKNVKKFRKSPVKKPSREFQLFSQDSETQSSQDESTESPELGRGKRKRVKKSFFGFEDEGEGDTKKSPLKPYPSNADVTVASCSKIREDSAVSPVLEASQETEAPRRERPRKQAFMTSESDEPRNIMDRYRSDDFFAKSHTSEASSEMRGTTLEVRQASIKSDFARLSAEMNLTRMKNSLKARLNLAQISEKGSGDLEAAMSTGEALRSCVTPALKQTEHTPENDVVEPSVSESDGSQILTSPVRQRGRGRSLKSPRIESQQKKTTVNIAKEGTLSQDHIAFVDPVKSPKASNKVDTSGTDTSPAAMMSSLESSSLGTIVKPTEVISPVQPRRGRPLKTARKPSPIPSSPSVSEDVASVKTVTGDLATAPPTVTSAMVESSSQQLGKGARRGRRKNMGTDSQESHSELSQASQSSVTPKNGMKSRVARNTSLSSPSKPVPNHPPQRRKRKLNGSENSENQETACEENLNKPLIETDIELVDNSLNQNIAQTGNSPSEVVKTSKSPPRRGRGRPKKSAESSSSNALEPSTSSAASPKTRRLGTKYNSQDSALETLSQATTSSKPKALKRGNEEPLKTTEENHSKKAKLVSYDRKDNVVENVSSVVDEKVSKRISKRGAKGMESIEDLPDSRSASQASSTGSSVVGRGKRKANDAPQVPGSSETPNPKDSSVEVVSASKTRGRQKKVPDAVKRKHVSPDTTEEVSTETLSSTKPRGRPKRFANNLAEPEDAVKDESATQVPSASKNKGHPKKETQCPAEIEGSVVNNALQVPSASKARGRPKKADQGTAETHENEQNDSASQVQSASKARGRPKKVVRGPTEIPDDPQDESSKQVPSASKARGGAKKPIHDPVELVDHSLHASLEVAATAGPSASKARGRAKKPIVDPVDFEDHSLHASMEVAATAGPSASKARGRRKPARIAAEEENSQDLSQGRRSGRARKKKESFDEIVSRKEEEIRLKKLQRSLEQSPSPDKSSHASLVTPSASVATIGDESAFSVPISPASSIAGKRSASRLGASSTESLSSSSKIRKKEDPPSKPPVQVKVMFTALADTKLSAMIRNLGGKVVEKPKDCTVLVTDKIKRTAKFLCALGLGKPIVSPNWISKSKAFSQFTDPNESLLKDSEGETKFEFQLSSSLEKARSSRLLEGYSVYTTGSILPPSKEMKPIIECSGGNFLSKPPSKWPPRSVVISDPKDKSEWPKLTKHGVTPPILSAEAILTGILQQRFDLERHRLK